MSSGTAEPTKRKARRLQKAMTARFLADAPTYTWCRQFVIDSRNLAWSDWLTLEANASSQWRAALDVARKAVTG